MVLVALAAHGFTIQFHNVDEKASFTFLLFIFYSWAYVMLHHTIFVIMLEQTFSLSRKLLSYYYTRSIYLSYIIRTEYSTYYYTSDYTYLPGNMYLYS